jgi:D-glycero-beta-D-manno-heptose-7-phosphate kinase
MTIRQLLEDFSSKTVVVIGDVMIDAYILGKVNRVSPEAPVPIVSLTAREERLGGAANVALNLKALGAKPVLCSVIGNDSDGQRLSSLLLEQEMVTDGVVRSDDRVTTVKTRVIGNHQHLLRIDAEDVHDLNKWEENALIAHLSGIIAGQRPDAVIFEDYNKGVLTKRVISEAIALCREAGIPTAVDPKKDNFLEYRGVTLFKPNLKELREGLKMEFEFSDSAKFLQAVEELGERLDNEITFVTLSENGVYIQKDGAGVHIPAHVRSILDVSGAGDTVISVAALCLASGMSIETIAGLSNLAGGLVCESSGVVTIDPARLAEECGDKELN